jgi:hypothetical protein
VRISARRDVCEAGLMQGAHQKVAGPAGAISREDASRAIGTMGCRGEPKNQHSGLWITETWHRPRPIDVVAKGAPFFAPDALAIGSESRAALAGNDRGPGGSQRR